MTQAIGGYFGLSVSLKQSEPRANIGLRLNLGRNALEYILRVRGYKKIYIPYYTCEVVLEPIRRLGVECAFYHIDWHLEVDWGMSDIQLASGVAFLYTNYYGLKDAYINQLALRIGPNLIVDNAQALFSVGTVGDRFYSLRKFVGVPDGAYVEMDENRHYTPLDDLEQDESSSRMKHLVLRAMYGAEVGFNQYQEHEHNLCGLPLRTMSVLTQRLAFGEDYNALTCRRRDNFEYIQSYLKSEAPFALNISLEDNAVPMAFPYYVEDESLRQRLIDNRIFVPRFWSNVFDWTQPDDIEYKLAKYLLPLPIDQRYGEEEMKKIIEIICTSQK